jgi:proteasome lid subunit RPN8/RPN11
MKGSNHQPLTPIYLKMDETMPWPEDKTFYVLSRDGLFLCRNHQFFSSCVPADRWPSELAAQRPFLQFDYPRLPQRLVEQVVGFFDIIGEQYASEAAVLLAWNRETGEIQGLVPEQTGTVGYSYYGKPYPMDLRYDVPQLPPHLLLIGDIHSHVDGAAYASWTDKADEAYRPGLHLVVGRIRDEPPEFYCAVVADGTRFRVQDLARVMEGYRCRRQDEVPPEWIARVSVEEWSSANRRSTCSSSACRSVPLLTSGSGLDETVAVHRASGAPAPPDAGNPSKNGSAASSE